MEENKIVSDIAKQNLFTAGHSSVVCSVPLSPFESPGHWPHPGPMSLETCRLRLQGVTSRLLSLSKAVLCYGANYPPTLRGLSVAHGEQGLCLARTERPSQSAPAVPQEVMEAETRVGGPQELEGVFPRTFRADTVL